MSRILVFLIITSGYSFADAWDWTCRNGNFTSYRDDKRGFLEAKIISESGRAYFFKDTYPNDKLVKSSAYVVNGDTVIVSKEKDGWSCVLFLGSKREYVGWVDSKEIKQIPTTMVVNWAGVYEDLSKLKRIEIKLMANDLLKITGSAQWIGGESSDGERIIHHGEINSLSTPSDIYLPFIASDLEYEPNPEYDCAGYMYLINGKLIVDDNGKCGGVNVTFDGVYRIIARGN
ncbi:hypothetical protein DCF83_17820 (plasmid) [Edwardsiella tarda]|uniref:hypothetical protein n=1 Tax=Edwardsiella tarda TaxID=636 RepID=UPI0011B22A37|nr:hypothetical protein [Edwardsiella tarda]UCQ29532.1 hypothetical protein DCF83_17820 [Edwardsiella tarda]